MDVSTSWSDDERSKFILGLQQFGSDWNRIARVVDSKSVQEVYEYASLHYKTMMTGKDLRSLESMQSGVSLLSEQLKSPGVKRLGGVTVPLSKKRKQSATSSSSTTDFFAGVNALAMVSCEALQRFNLKYMRRGATPDSTDLPSDSDGPSDTDLLPRQRLLQTPASHQCSVPWDFSIAPKQDADKLDTAKRAKWSDDEHRQLLTGVEMRTKVPEHPPSKSYAHFPKTEKSNARGDVLEVAGFLSSLAQVTSPTSESARFDTRMSSAPHVDDL
ncbi:hypothetical protein DYB32_000716 [Aphanomyces invadans]|uniref:SANT domain-containing protein n=1 Tax=Aphanomyces invadans TaxID=157072 RepID=A0A3R6Z5H9_9STRA|nr:hypothetical protein DYB32_000716 [Aphanomyces invadans]